VQRHDTATHQGHIEVAIGHNHGMACLTEIVRHYQRTESGRQREATVIGIAAMGPARFDEQE